MTALIEPAVLESRAHTVECRSVEVLVHIGDVDRLRAVVAHVLDRCDRRWCGRTDIDAFPPIQRWQHVQYVPGRHTPGEHIRLAAAGRRPHLGPIAGLEAALMMTSGCPALVTAIDDSNRSARGSLDRPSPFVRTLAITLFALDADDLALAEGLLDAVTHSCGATLADRNVQYRQLPCAG